MSTKLRFSLFVRPRPPVEIGWPPLLRGFRSAVKWHFLFTKHYLAIAAITWSPAVHREGRILVLNLPTVAQFVIEREVPGAGSLSDVQIREMSLRSLQVLSAMGPQIQWLHSYVTEDKVYCVYLAPDEDSIREHARRAGIPADRVSAVRRLIDPAALG
jgi:Protein of unknown function (DUF4242)